MHRLWICSSRLRQGLCCLGRDLASVQNILPGTLLSVDFFLGYVLKSSDSGLDSGNSCWRLLEIHVHRQNWDFHLTSMHHNQCTLEQGWLAQFPSLRRSLSSDSNESSLMSYLSSQRLRFGYPTADDPLEGPCFLWVWERRVWNLFELNKKESISTRFFGNWRNHLNKKN